MKKARFGFLDVVNILVMVYLLLPIAIIFLFSFNPNSAGTFPMQGFSGKWYVNLVHNRNFLAAAKNSVYVALAVAALSTIIGTLASFALTRHSFPLRVISAATLIPIARLGSSWASRPVLLLPGTHALPFTVIVGHAIFCIFPSSS
jgi:ABC-type spermidine/putrescine transport system permease subunit II